MVQARVASREGGTKPMPHCLKASRGAAQPDHPNTCLGQTQQLSHRSQNVSFTAVTGSEENTPKTAVCRPNFMQLCIISTIKKRPVMYSVNL